MVDSYRVDGLHVLSASPPGSAPRRPPLLLVHGGLHGAWCWEGWLERLPALGWEAHALSLRNHPGSREVERETYLQRTTVDDYADDVAAVARHIGRPAVVVGHSMGGIVAQRFVARAGTEPDLPAPAALVLLASVPPGALGPIREQPYPTERPMLLDAATARRMFFHSAPEAAVQAALGRLVGESPSVVNSYSLGAGLAVPAEAVRCPVLVVTAGHDGTPCPRDGRIADYYGGTHWHEPELGHNLMLETGWEALLERIAGWLAAHAPAA